MIPRTGRPARPGLPHRRRPGAYAILARGGLILLTVQQTEEGPDVQLPGGGIDPGEQTRPALLREVREETGHAAVIGRHVGSFREFRWMPEYGMHAEKVCHVFEGRAGPRLHPPTEAGHAALWLPPRDALRRLSSEGGRAMLARWLRRTGQPVPGA